jgi:aspartate 1-decarboxylase
VKKDKSAQAIMARLPAHAMIRACMAKIHRATVTEANLDYVGSITIDQKLLNAVGMQANQYVIITNISNGAIWQTYIMPGKPGSGVICLNGSPARHFQPGDKIIVFAEIWLPPSELTGLTMRTVFVDGRNKITKVKATPSGRQV